jgi:hypothetical protein
VRAPAAPPQATSEQARSQLVTAAQIARQPAGSPQRALLEFWREMQYRNVPLAVDYFDPRLRVTERRLSDTISVVARHRKLGDTALAIREVDVRGKTATVRTVLTLESSPADGEFSYDELAQAFNMRRTDGRWRLADNNFLTQETSFSNSP